MSAAELELEHEELHRRIDVALDALVDVERAVGEDDATDGWVWQSRLALLAAADTARRAKREHELDELDAQLEQLERDSIDAALDEHADELDRERYRRHG